MIVKHKKNLNKKKRSRNVFFKTSAEAEVSKKSEKQIKTSKKVQIKDQTKKILLKKPFTNKSSVIKLSSIKKNRIWITKQFEKEILRIFFKSKYQTINSAKHIC